MTRPGWWRQAVRAHPVPVWLVLCFGVSWGTWGGVLLAGARVYPGSHASHLPGLLGPLVATVAVLVAG